jgi:hypothetical protein
MATVPTVMTVNVEQAVSRTDQPGEGCPSLLGNTIIPNGNMDMSQAMSPSQVHVRASTIDTHHCLDAHLFEALQSPLSMRLTTRVNAVGHTYDVV